ncbi:hypothetical protein NPIL_521061 [Nephila pilipes]|uniref:Uncharacterized protein n=1 Tax=Nephila pilipes TaxID=299642 RepID=A0A8X6NHB1_NEPPI|nr:hypothetical protein NPIL_521061 [Nephila pilipes]
MPPRESEEEENGKRGSLLGEGKRRWVLVTSSDLEQYSPCLRIWLYASLKQYMRLCAFLWVIIKVTDNTPMDITKHNVFSAVHCWFPFL